MLLVSYKLQYYNFRFCATVRTRSNTKLYNVVRHQLYAIYRPWFTFFAKNSTVIRIAAGKTRAPQQYLLFRISPRDLRPELSLSRERHCTGVVYNVSLSLSPSKPFLMVVSP